MSIKPVAEVKSEIMVASAAITSPTTSDLECLLNGQASTIKKIDHFSTGSLGYLDRLIGSLSYNLLKFSTHFTCLSFLTSSETKKVIREITALDNLTGQIRTTANKIAKVLHNTILDNASTSVEELVTLAKDLASLEGHDFLGSKTAYVEALSNLVKDNNAGFLYTNCKVENIQAFKEYLLQVIERGPSTFTGTCDSTLPSSEARAATVSYQAAEKIPAQMPTLLQDPTLEGILSQNRPEAETLADLQSYYSAMLRAAVLAQVTPQDTSIIACPTNPTTAPSSEAPKEPEHRRTSIADILARDLPQAQEPQRVSEGDLHEEDLMVTNERLRSRLKGITAQYGLTFQLAMPHNSAIIAPTIVQAEPLQRDLTEGAAAAEIESPEQITQKEIVKLLERFVPKFLIEDKIFLKGFILKKEALSSQHIYDIARINPKLAEQLRCLEKIIKILSQKEDVSEILLQVIKSQGTSNSLENLVWHLKYLLPDFQEIKPPQMRKKQQLLAEEAIYKTLREASLN